jgi:hypothetical protein
MRCGVAVVDVEMASKEQDGHASPRRRFSKPKPRTGRDCRARKDAAKDLIAEKIDKQTWIDRIRARAAYKRPSTATDNTAAPPAVARPSHWAPGPPRGTSPSLETFLTSHQ